MQSNYGQSDECESELKTLSLAPRQPDEGAPEAWLVLEADMADGLRGLAARR